MKLSHFFLPHPDTHRKAHLLSFQALAIYILFFIGLHFGLNELNHFSPNVLGIAANVDTAELIRLTNVERANAGLPPLTEDSKLDNAAAGKAQDMFTDNYWAHFGPSGKSPWDFIKGAGYSFTYAGENLARNFYNSSDVVKAWMASPTHKENIVNSHYTNIGMAVREGTLNGEKTILVVQEFGTPVEYIAQAPATSPTAAKAAPSEQQAAVKVNPSPKEEPSPKLSPSPSSQTLVAGTKTFSFQNISVPREIDPFLMYRTFGITILLFIFLLILLDLYILRRRAVIRLYSRHLPHLALISVGLSVLTNVSTGSIL